ncbi:MAG: transcriptional regulator, MarR [Rickettsiaceae bacterium]|jgi:hypothetical protein|nr:transcriptional regulator, MarR [Rickettsiaceae bacterium]
MSRTILKPVIIMIENIQKKDFLIPIKEEINIGILKAEQEYCYNNSYNFWYAIEMINARRLKNFLL